MEKLIFIESVLLEVNGGTLNSESAVHREDIEAYLPIAVNYAMTSSYNNNIKEGDGREISGVYTGTFYELNIVRSLGRAPYVTLPKGTVALPRNQGIRLIEDGCGGVFTPLSDADRRTVKYYEQLLPNEKFFRLTKDMLELYNISAIMDKLKRLDMIVSVEDLEDTDELPLQAGIEILAMEQCIAKFSRQRQLPSDKKTDTVDINSIPQP